MRPADGLLALGDVAGDTALEPDELLTEIRVPKSGGAGWSFQKFNRRAQDWAIVGVAAQLGALLWAPNETRTETKPDRIDDEPST